jgi:hypothetical protein
METKSEDNISEKRGPGRPKKTKEEKQINKAKYMKSYQKFRYDTDKKYKNMKKTKATIYYYDNKKKI